MKKGLGRGFDSLIPATLIDETFDPTATQDDKLSRLVDLPLDKIIADPGQPRRFFDDGALAELTESVREHGVVQPIVVTAEGLKYMIVAGERRYRAAQQAGLTEIPAIVRTLSAQHRLEISLIENLQRRDLNPIETATAYAKLRDQFNMTLEQIGARVGGKSISAVSNTLRLLKLPKQVKEAIFNGELSEGQARPIIGLPESDALELANRIIKEDWSVRRIEQWITAHKQASKEGGKHVASDRPHQSDMDRLASRFGTHVAISTNTKGAGKITISFKDDEEFNRISRLIG